MAWQTLTSSTGEAGIRPVAQFPIMSRYGRTAIESADTGQPQRLRTGSGSHARDLGHLSARSCARVIWNRRPAMPSLRISAGNFFTICLLRSFLLAKSSHD